MNFTFKEAMKDTPPFLVYYMSDRDRGGPSPARIVQRTKEDGIASLSERTITRLSQSISWDRWTLDTIDAFCLAVGAYFIHGATAQRGRYMRPMRQLFLKRPYRDLMWRIANKKIKKPLKHLTPSQIKRFEVCCCRWTAAQEQA